MTASRSASGERRHGACMGRHPGAPAVAGGIELRQRCAAQVVVRQRGSKGIASADCIDHLRRIAGMAIDFIARDQQTSLSSQRDGDQLHGKLVDDLARAVEQEIRRGARLRPESPARRAPAASHPHST